jgi:hypothetical protein
MRPFIVAEREADDAGLGMFHHEDLPAYQALLKNAVVWAAGR